MYVKTNMISLAVVSKPNDCIFPYDFKEAIKKKVISFCWPSDCSTSKYEHHVALGESCKRNMQRNGMVISLVFTLQT